MTEAHKEKLRNFMETGKVNVSLPVELRAAVVREMNKYPPMSTASFISYLVSEGIKACAKKTR